jgi:hypothetical protein
MAQVWLRLAENYEEAEVVGRTKAAEEARPVIQQQQQIRPKKETCRLSASGTRSYGRLSLTRHDATLVNQRDRTPWLNGRGMFKHIGRDLVCLRGSTPH